MATMEQYSVYICLHRNGIRFANQFAARMILIRIASIVRGLLEGIRKFSCETYVYLMSGSIVFRTHECPLIMVCKVLRRYYEKNNNGDLNNVENSLNPQRSKSSIICLLKLLAAITMLGNNANGFVDTHNSRVHAHIQILSTIILHIARIRCTHNNKQTILFDTFPKFIRISKPNGVTKTSSTNLPK